MRDVKGSGFILLFVLNYFDVYCVDSFYVDFNYVDNCINFYYMLQESRQRMRFYFIIGFFYYNYFNSLSFEDLNQQFVWFQGGDWGFSGSLGGEEL